MSEDRADLSAETPQWVNQIHQGDCFEVLEELPAESVHAVVTDPPYGLNFMGKDWDNFRRRNNEDDVGRDNVGGRLSARAPASGAETDMKRYQEWCERWASKARRVLKPGGHLLAFSGNRTHHRLFTGVEDAGFEVRDTLTWHYGSGFPKATDVSKTIDKRADAEREDLGPNPHAVGRSYNKTGGDYNNDHEEDRADVDRITKPATDAAKRWEGWKTGLKPATEFVVMARKPFDGATVDCVLDYGTGALNVGECRIGTEERENQPTSHNDNCYSDAGDRSPENVKGRYPPNVAFDEHAANDLDEQVGDTHGGDPRGVCNGDRPGGFADVGAKNGDGEPNARVYQDEGGPSRYFYTSKATRAERTLDGQIDNAHPTVKPLDLMEWLVKLVTAKDQIVLDPFTGTGTTCKAAKRQRRKFIGVEQSERWADVARARVGLTVEDPANVRASDGPQAGLEAFADGGEPSDD